VRPDGLPALLDGLGPEWAGLSLTMPLKQTVLGLLDEQSDLARAAGAVNTVLLQDGRRRGENTDVHGIVAALREAGVEEPPASVVLGGGATAASALAALAELGERAAHVFVRDLDRAGPLRAAAERLGVDLVLGRLDEAPRRLRPELDVLVSTLPAGAADAVARPLARALAPAARPVLLDVVYEPWPTALARAWAGPVVGGAVMLLHQAARQVELMTGRPAPLAAMRAALDARLLSSPGVLPPM